nr:hypothetical protein [Tanacetum cinerariifolium]
DELSERELKHIKADDQAIQTILLGFPEEIYAAVDSCETAQEIWLRVQQMMKGSDIGIQEKKAKLFNEWERFTSNEGESIESYYHRFLKLMNDLKRNKHFPEKIAINLKFLNNLQPEWCRHVTIVHQTKDLHTTDYTQLYDFLKYNQKENFLQQPITNPEDITDPRTAMNMALALMAKAFKLNYSTPTNNNQRISSNPRNRQIAQPGMNMGQDRQMQMIGGNGGNQFRQYAGQNAGNLNGYNDVQNVRNQIRNGNLVAARAEGNAAGKNGNQIRCYNCRGIGHYARNCTARPRRRDAAYLQTQLLIAQKEEAGIQLQAEEYDLMAAAADLDEVEEVNANCILMANLQQASSSGTRTDSAPVYDYDGSAEVHENYDNNEIFNMFTQEEQYTELLEPIPELHQVPQNDNEVISEVTGVEQDGETVEQHSANFEETRALYESLYQNLVVEVEKVNSVNRKLKETNADLTTELARVRASKPKTMQDAIEIATKLMNKKKSTLVECQIENKKRLDNTYKNNQNQQQPNKRQNTGKAYTARHREKKHYGGSKPLCFKCNYHHNGPCAPKCHKCNRVGHLARDCRSSKNANTTNIQKGIGASQKATCYECGNQGHYRRDCPERKNQNHENQIKSTKARGVVHAFGGGETEQDLNNIEDEIEA